LAHIDNMEEWNFIIDGSASLNDPSFEQGSLEDLIIRGKRDEIDALRQAFTKRLRRNRTEQLPDWTDLSARKGLSDTSDVDVVPTCTEALAWAILVESALLNQHLIQDMKRVAALRGCGCMNPEGMRFYMPNPEMPERQAFAEYVRCRWPIHVFALDPVMQDQNLADKATIRRELQLAVSLAFVTGKMNVNNFTKFVRKFEAAYETIALNRTAVGFSHGDDTFGWRFMPRFQTPPTKGNLAALHQTVWGAPSECDLCDRQLEPGMRECTAIVIMPSFVPYVTFDVRTNWFRLTHHHGLLPTRHNLEPSMTDAMKLSRAIQSMHQTAAHICDAGNYRDGEVNRLLQRVHQLDRELPLQSTVAQVPIENTLGGFEMFNNGVTDLAPELYGWYGGPGILKEIKPMTLTCTTTTSTLNGLGGFPVANPPEICPCVGGTTLFLVGDHFSVHDTKVVAGDQCIKDVSLISRQIMRVTIPTNVAINMIDGVPYVDVHVATPYGVTGHLHIPYVDPATPNDASKKSSTAAAPAAPAASAPSVPANAAPKGATAAPTPTPTPAGVAPSTNVLQPAPPAKPSATKTDNCEGCGSSAEETSLSPSHNELRFLSPSSGPNLGKLPCSALYRLLGWRHSHEPQLLPMFDPQMQPVSYLQPLPPIETTAQ
jgi:hypothetical protein